MKYNYDKDISVSYTDIDPTNHLSLTSIIAAVQDLMTEYFETFGSDNLTLANNDNAVWVLTKTAVHIRGELPRWLDKIHLHSLTTLKRLVKMEIQSIFEDKDGEPVIIVDQEICPMDLSERTIRRISTVSFPDDLETEEPVIKTPFFNLRDIMQSYDGSRRYSIQYSDIDFSGHLNNVNYVNYMLNCFDVEFWSSKTLADFEIHYIKECKEGEEIVVYHRKEENKVYFSITKEEEEIASAVAVFKE